MKQQLILVGGGGHARSVADTLKNQSQYEVIGILDTSIPVGNMVEGIPVLGKDEAAETFFRKGVGHAFITLGSIGKCSIRKKLVDQLKQIGFNFPIIIDSTAIVASNVKLSEGCFVGKGAILNVGVEIGKHCIINSGALVEHDCKIGDWVHLAPRSVVCGNVRIEDETHIGAGSTVIQGIHIGEKCLIGAGSVVVNHINAHKKAYGNPCKEVRDYE